MPRDGTQTYVLPFPDVEEDTTIESTVYNGFTNDVAADLNAARPILAGGTGATNANDARFNLASEAAAQTVTNYDSHLWVPGSFRSATTATGAPVTDHAFAGVCYIGEALANPPTNQNVIVEAVDTTDPINIVKYIRVKTSGTWGLWTGVGSGSAAASIGEYTFNSTITFPPTAGQIRLNNATQNSATEIFISHTTTLGGDVTNLIPFSLKSGSDIAIQDKDEITKYKIFTTTANPVLSGSDYRVTATFKSGGADLVSAQRVLVGANSGADVIADAAIAAKAVRYDAAQTLTTNQQAQARANIAVIKKNYIINGAMMVSQENGSTASSSIIADYYPVDTFHVVGSNAAVGQTHQAGIVTPGGSTMRIRVVVNTADATVDAGDYQQILHSIEGLRVADLQWGTASAKTVTLQFGVKAPAGTYCVTFSNAPGSRSYVGEYVIAAGEANTDVVKSITVLGDTAGTWVKDNAAGLVLHWALMCGLTYQQAAGAWTGNNVAGSSNQFNFMGTNGNIFELFDVSLTEGTVAPPFQVPDYASELALCKRYYFKSYNYSTAPGSVMSTGTGRIYLAGARTGSYCSGYLVYPIPLRTAPTLTMYNNAGTAGLASYYTGTWNNGGVVTVINPGETGVGWTAATSSIADMYNFDIVANARL